MVQNTNESAALEPLLMPAEVTSLLRVDITTLMRLCRKGELPRPVRIGGGNRWKARDIFAVLEGSDSWKHDQKRVPEPETTR